ncbi:hypothetical protein D1814_04975 [Alteromonas sp. BL110]|nr:hypothetical protein D1814_04975 [Alteromonas sp. BL110]RKM80811.1 hypothetical protein D7031_18320 [Alteromonas sp. BL110]
MVQFNKFHSFPEGYNAKLWGASTWAKIRAKRASPRVSVPATEGSANSVLLGVQRNVRSFAATTSQIGRVFKLLNLR